MTGLSLTVPYKHHEGAIRGDSPNVQDQGDDMQNGIGSARGGGGRLRRGSSMVAVLAGLAIFASACGDSPGSNPGSSGTASSSSRYSQALAQSECMRSHGIPDYPDPNSAGGIVIDNKNGSIDENSPQYISANSACQKLEPNGGQVSSQNRSQLLNNALRFTQCMRAHGIPRFPDPAANGNGGSFDLQGSGVNPNSPQVQSAWQFCARSTHFNF